MQVLTPGKAGIKHTNTFYQTIEIKVLGLQKMNVKLLKSHVLSCIECKLQNVENCSFRIAEKKVFS